MENCALPEAATSTLDEHTPDSARGLTRRQLGIAAAWAAPVVTLVATAPMASASPNQPGVLKYVVIAGNAQTTGPGEVDGAFTQGEFRYEDDADGQWPSGPITATATVGSVPEGSLTSATFNNPLTNQPYELNEVIIMGIGNNYNPLVTWTVVSINATSITFSAPSVQLYGGGIARVRFPLPEGSGTGDGTTTDIVLRYSVQLPLIGVNAQNEIILEL